MTAFSSLLAVGLAAGVAMWWLRRQPLLEALAATLVTLMLFVWVTTEALSLAGLFSIGPVRVVWLAGAAIAITLAIRDRQRPMVSTWNRTVAGLLLVTMLWAVPLIAISLGSAPNNHDTLVYHLPRIAHWLDYGSVAHFPTSITRQVYQPALFEYCGAHLFALTGAWNAIPLVQTGGLLAAALLGAGIASRFCGGRFPAAFLALAGILTLPPAILQATSAKNDVFLAMTCMLAMVGLLELGRGSARFGAVTTIAASALALATKGTAFALVPPILAVGAWRWARRRDRTGEWRIAFVAAMVAAALLAPAALRNFESFGSPLTSPQAAQGEFRYSNETLSKSTLVSNLARNATLHAGWPSPEATRRTERWVRERLIAARIDPDDPRTTWPGAEFVNVARPYPARHEDFPAAPAHLLWAFLAVALVPIAWMRSRFQTLALFGIVLAGAVAFSLAFKWQPWHGRLHIPFWAFAVPPLAATTFRAFGGRLATVLGIALLASASPFLLANQSRPLLPWPGILAAPLETTTPGGAGPDNRYRVITGEAARRGWRRVGLVLGSDDWEFPFWWHASRIEAPISWRHAFVGNQTARLLESTSRQDGLVVALTPGSRGPALVERLLTSGVQPLDLAASGFVVFDLSEQAPGSFPLFDDDFESGDLGEWNVGRP
jgi:hypothetical protein